ncbi:tetratricopeptide repeat protein [Helcobacillus massiliensis]|uniref:Putative Zn-dependent protease n=1 Tax=Helcobacillus massiliensis TaxID=521392 RepID=A0A839QRV5_9MICO|nr:tetratricopeptide repeat protein [Helcobacillus massiliensis]MBB3023213.1 putative Zn-dependent protease [Helcobacillus massiliensis]MDK7742008.1 hypothetical protein [Helcobacillus massiliensis]WOO93083.1 hypothetical protein R3I40_00355 [Helcobacillus massiliensis]
MTSEIPAQPIAACGWYIDVRTLLPVINDLAAFRAHYAADPARDAVEALWTGHPDRAEQLLMELSAENPSNLRYRALLADAHRDQGDTDWAVAAYHQLVDATRGGALEAVMWQHLGKALFVAGSFTEAENAFSRALDLRIAGGADDDLIESSMLALDRAKQLAHSETSRMIGA